MTAGLVFLLWSVSVAVVIATISAMHHHHWGPWSGYCNDDRPIYITGAYGSRKLEVSICATCSRMKMRAVPWTENS
jgi:hypothetical protein